jgi:Ser/Thr protein kinase RdoA (MazF antagonist)
MTAVPMSTVDAVLAEYPPDCRPTDITPPAVSSVEPLGSAGGMSGAQFWRITVARGAVRGSPDPAQPGIFALRRWPPEHPSADRLQFIHAVLRHTASHGIDFLPLPLTTTGGESFVRYGGRLWELAPWMPGKADYGHSPSTEKLRAAMTALAKFHVAVSNFPRTSAPGSAGGPNAIVRHLTRLRELTPERICELSRSITDSTWPELAPLARQFVAALPHAIPLAAGQLEPLAKINFPLHPCLRDIWHDHVLFTGDEVTGLVDFGAIDFDTPATDIARLLGSFTSVSPLPFREGQGEGSIRATLDQSQTWHDGLAAYNTIRQLSPDETRATYALSISGNILAGCNWIEWIYHKGRQFENRQQVLKRFQRIVSHMENR